MQIKRLLQYKKHRQPKGVWRAKVFDRLGRVCKRCGFDDIRALQIDHVFGGGTKERKKLGTTAFYKRVLLCPEE